MDIRQFRSREFATFFGLVILFLAVSGLLGVLKIWFPQSVLMFLLCIAVMLGLWAYVLDYMLRHLRDDKPSFLLYLALYFVLATLVIMGFALFMDPGLLSSFGESLPISILASARAFCSGDESILTKFPAWRLIATAEATIGYSLIALLFGAVIQQGLPRLGENAPRPSRRKKPKPAKART
jgi:hypothetical protein